MQCNCQYSNLCYDLIIMSIKRETLGPSSEETEFSQSAFESKGEILETQELSYSDSEGISEEGCEPFVVGPDRSVDELIARLKREQSQQE